MVVQSRTPSVSSKGPETAKRQPSHSSSPVSSDLQAGPAGAVQRILGPTGTSSRQAGVRALQQTVGNGAVQRLLAQPRQGASPGRRIQRYATEGHQEATISSLRSTFSAEEIGLIYKANWERDLSQGPIQINNAMVAWKAVKMSAALNQGAPDERSMERFRIAVRRLIEMPISGATNTSLGGYTYWEHMDTPSWMEADEADRRWYGTEERRSPSGVTLTYGKQGPIPGAVMDSRAYIKDSIVKAVDLYRQRTGKAPAGTGIDNWQTRRGGKQVEVPRPAGYPGTQPLNPGVTATVADETERMAKQAGARSAALDPAFVESAEHLGRAMHSVEDFFAHSNWLELQEKRRPGGPEAKGLITGTFEMPDKTHALGHKLTLLADGLLAEHALLLKVYGLEGKRIPERKNPIAGTKSLTGIGHLLDVAAAADIIEEQSRSGPVKIEHYIASREFLQSLKAKGEDMMRHGESSAPETGHARIAKDAPEPGEKSYEKALELTTRANELIFAPLRAIMDEPDPVKARQQLEAQLRMVDQILAPPSRQHEAIGLLKK